MRTGSPLFIYDSLVQLSSAAAERVIDIANEAIGKRGVFRIALAGGSTPKGLYEVLSSHEYSRKTDWSAWEVYFSDERVVPLTDDRSNYAMVKSSLFDGAQFKEGNIYIPPVHLNDPAQVAEAYEALIRRNVAADDESVPSLDLVLLGLGSDGHTASLFPGKPAIEAVNRLVVESMPGVLPPDVDRVTFTLPFINAARHVMFLASGKDKQAAFSAAYSGVALGDVHQVPAYFVQPGSGSLEWFITNELAS